MKMFLHATAFTLAIVWAVFNLALFFGILFTQKESEVKEACGSPMAKIELLIPAGRLACAIRPWAYSPLFPEKEYNE